MKRTTIFIIQYVVFWSIIQGQNCKLDSLSFNKIESCINSLISNQEIYFFNNKEFCFMLNGTDSSLAMPEFRNSLMNNGPNSICEVKKYAYVFDLLIELGVNMNGRLPQPTSRNNRVNLTQGNEPINKNESQEAYNLFFLFTNIKGIYEFNNRDILSSEKKITYINNIITYGNYKNPLVVKNILLLKYKHITKDKFNEDMKYYDKLNR